MKTLLKLEMLSLLVVSLFTYFSVFHFNLWLFLLLILTPDLSMIGYLINSKIGAYSYNSVHNLILPSILVVIGLMASNDLFIMFAIILYSHIFADRSLGYGLKYTTSFKSTHLN
ncbi:DUF4260 family protein [Holzapfeliella sp. He02]|uniref:DUF4260 family protein n=1 Tax=Holzapfeliella saturejae TaxID=3082953 RepID=A0ABU8SEZ5_9LACO